MFLLLLKHQQKQQQLIHRSWVRKLLEIGRKSRSLRKRARLREDSLEGLGGEGVEGGSQEARYGRSVGASGWPPG